MTKNIIIVTLIAIIVWFGFVIADLEAYRYASVVGLCDEFDGTLPHERYECLKNAQPRTNAMWNFLYGIGLI